AQFAKTIEEVERTGASTPYDWKSLEQEVIADGISDTLTFAGEALLRELMEQLLACKGVEDFLKWAGVAQRLVRLLMQLGVWPPISRALEKALDGDHKLAARAVDLTKALQLSGLTPIDIFAILLPSGGRGTHEVLGRVDPYDDLAVLPLPRAIADPYLVGPLP